jgi:nitrogen regulatory protein PII
MANTSEYSRSERIMHFKLIVSLAEDEKTEQIMQAARKAGATGATVLEQARGQGLKTSRTFFGLNLETQRDMLLFLVEEHLCRNILETIAEIGQFDSTPGAGIAFQIDVEDAVGVGQQVIKLKDVVEKEI